MICLDALAGMPFSAAQPHGTISLVCQPGPGQVPHEFHGDCLEQWVTNAATKPEHSGHVTTTGLTIWKVLPPSCPLCRARFIAGGYWPGLAYADAYPEGGHHYDDNGVVYLITDTDSDESEDSEVSEDEDDGGQFEDSSDDEGPVIVGTFVCSVCQVNSGHVEVTADEFLAHTANPAPACHICATPIQQGDTEPVLYCLNCGAPSHYHDG